jgi:hypothetical protein
MEEIWVDIQGYDGKYRISNKGNILSTNYNNTRKPGLLKPKINRYGYREIKLSKNNKTKNFLIITLVAEHFLKKPAPDMIPMHLKEIDDDSVENIAYGYRSEMLHLMYKKGHRKIGKPSKNIISYKGKKYRHFFDMAKEYGISAKQFNKRLNRGWTLEESLEIPINRKKHILKVKLYEYNGKLYSVKQLSEISGIDTKAIYKRLKRGWNIYEAIEIPLLKKERK